mmetsp:Transcript_72165/g.119585  ORF Transcript_72165/g.119585 Transcript_72165/m.119585 type:complete len:212 (-) Transcript_72165:335-970(-)
MRPVQQLPGGRLPRPSGAELRRHWQASLLQVGCGGADWEDRLPRKPGSPGPDHRCAPAWIRLSLRSSQSDAPSSCERNQGLLGIARPDAAGLARPCPDPAACPLPACRSAPPQPSGDRPLQHLQSHRLLPALRLFPPLASPSYPSRLSVTEPSPQLPASRSAAQHSSPRGVLHDPDLCPAAPSEPAESRPGRFPCFPPYARSSAVVPSPQT